LEHKRLVAGILVLVVVGALVPLAFIDFSTHAEPYPDGFYMGIIETGTVAETKQLIDATKNYTNLIVISNMTTIKNLVSLEEVANYAYDAGLSFFCPYDLPYPV